jgi:hypothetical protein
MTGTGTMIFDVFGNDDAEQLQAGAATDLSGGIIQVRIASGYTPQIGHTYDLLGVGFTVDGTGANIASWDATGRHFITWDVSQWGVGDSSKGVLTIADIFSIPEPSTALLLVTGGWLLWRRRQR